jgi:putative endonuclease
MESSFVYILSNKPYGTLYIGATSNLLKRIWEHKKNLAEGFTKKYQTHSLVYYEEFRTVIEAFYREKQLKKWKRAWKIDLIMGMNPLWRDLSDDF